LIKCYFSFEACVSLSYSPKGGHGYGKQKHHLGRGKITRKSSSHTRRKDDGYDIEASFGYVPMRLSGLGFGFGGPTEKDVRDFRRAVNDLRKTLSTLTDDEKKQMGFT
jgi:hypothetical protein